MPHRKRLDMQRAELENLLEFAVRIAQAAGEVTLRYFQRATAERKSDGSFVTAADREAERLLRERIEERFPQDAILGEEEGARAGSSDRCWVIDPLDGTFSFVHGVPLYGTLIALEVEEEPILGAVHLPALGETVYAARGIGCFWNGARCQVSNVSRLEEALLLATDFGTCERYGFGRAAEALQHRAQARRTWGDCYGHILVATGRAEIMLDPVMNHWDCAALLPILEEAGGTFTDWRGTKTARGGNAISTNGALFEDVMKIIGSAPQI